MNILKGKFVLHDEGDTYRTGEIIEANEEFALIREHFRKDLIAPKNGMRLVPLLEIAMGVTEDDNRPEWLIFDTLEEIDTLMAWYEEPEIKKEDATVIPIKGH